MAKLRTIQRAYDEIKAQDPNTCISTNLIRQIILNGKIPSTKTGGKYLFDLNDLMNYLKGGC